MFHIICHEGNANLNRNEIPLPEWPTLEHWQHQMLVKMWSNRNSHSLLLGMQNGTATLEDSLMVSYKTKHTLIILFSNHAPWYLPKQVENLYPHKNLHMIFIAALFIIAKTWKQLRCPSVDEWINKLWYIQKMEHYSVLKRNEVSSHEKTWRKLKCVLLSERSQSERLHIVWLIQYILYNSNYMTFWKR